MAPRTPPPTPWPAGEEPDPDQLDWLCPGIWRTARNDLPAGNYRLRARCEGLRDAFANFVLAHGEVPEVSLILVPLGDSGRDR